MILRQSALRISVACSRPKRKMVHDFDVARLVPEAKSQSKWRKRTMF